MQTAYNDYSKKGKCFRLEKDLYVLPPAALAEVRRLPTQVLNSSAANEDVSLSISLKVFGLVRYLI